MSLYVTDRVGTCLWRVVRRGLDPEYDLVLEGVGVLVAGEEHVGVLEELTPENGWRQLSKIATFW